MARKTDKATATAETGVSVPVAGETAMVRLLGVEGLPVALAFAAYLAHGRQAFFAADPGSWLSWAHDMFGYERRFCFQCLKVGQLLLDSAECTNDALLK